MDNKMYEMIEGLSCSDVYFLMREKYPQSKRIKAMFERKCSN
ncbi:MAG TPA: hypothetical protein VJG49_04620 [Candidatus Nanoarchaeia archaeon]|nr:hypothetical protein [Candidatus Nanoarchaeia archaeon]